MIAVMVVNPPPISVTLLNCAGLPANVHEPSDMVLKSDAVFITLVTKPPL